MQIQRQPFTNKLTAVRPGLDKKEIFEQTTHFIFTGKAITTYNDQICISIPFESDFKCSVKAMDLYRIVQGLETDLLDLSLKNEKLVLQSTKTKASLSTIVDPEQTVEGLSETLRNDCLQKEWQKLPEEFLEAINLCIFSASTDATKGALTGLLLQGNNVFSSDHKRCSWFHMGEPIVSDPFIIEANHVKELVKFPIDRYQLHENWVHFGTEEGVMFSCRRLLGEYKDIKWIFEDTEGLEVAARVKLPDDLKKSVKMLEHMAETETTKLHVKIELKEDQMIVSAKKERGEAERVIPISYRRDPASFRIDPSFLTQILDKTTTLTITDTRVYFKSGTFKHVIALIVPPESVTPPPPEEDIPF
jgi:DNA polymerase III sliding clamp (beta) subunit (PCNA family)